MSPATSFKLAILRNPQGVSITDVSHVEPGGKRRPVVFRKVGDVIDLKTVDVKQFVRSVHVGVIKDMVKSGSLVPTPQELGERLMDELAAEAAKYAPTGRPTTVGAAAQITMLEPGVQVATGDGTFSESLPSLPNAAPTVMLEPGMMVADGSGLPETVVPAPKDLTDPSMAGLQPQTQGQAGVTLDTLDQAPTAAPVEVPPAETVVETWKTGKNLKQQEEYLVASTDKELLQGVIDDPAEDSARLKNVAKKRLAELAKK